MQGTQSLLFIAATHPPHTSSCAQVAPLDWIEWLVTIAIGFSTCIISWLVRFFTRSINWGNIDILWVRRGRRGMSGRGGSGRTMSGRTASGRYVDGRTTSGRTGSGRTVNRISPV